MKTAGHHRAEQGRHERCPPHQKSREKRRARIARRALHDSRLCGIKREHETERDAGHHVDPKNLRRRHRHGDAEKNRDDDRHRLAAVGRQRPAYDLDQIVVDDAALAHGGGDGGEIVIRQHHFGRFFGGLRALEAHGDADVGALERGRVILTPSPVIETTAPSACNALDQPKFVLGTSCGPKTEVVGSERRSAASSIASIAWPVSASTVPLPKPSSRAIAAAVEA